MANRNTSRGTFRDVAAMRSFFTSFLLKICLVAGMAAAHDLYILPQSFRVDPGSKLSVGYHNGDSFPQSEASPSLARLRDAKLVGASGTASVFDLEVAGKRTIGTVDIPKSAGTLILSVHTTPNFLQLQPDKFLDYLKEEGLNHVIAWRKEHGEANKPSRERYSKFAKSLIVSGAPDDTYKKVMDFPIEIIPDTNPAAVRPGGDLPVRVVFRGKPAASLQLEAAWSDGVKSKTTISGRTDAEGRIRVPIATSGQWRLHTLLMERCSDPAAADWESFWASLTFEVR